MKNLDKRYKTLLENLSAYLKEYEKERGDLPQGWEYKVAEMLLHKYCKKTGQSPHIVLVEDFNRNVVPNLFEFLGFDYRDEDDNL